MAQLPDPRPSRPLSVRLPAIVIDALAAQRPKEFSSVNAWLCSVISDLVDRDKLTRPQRWEWQLTADPMTRAGRK
jgi:alpha-beta hydrolase superfamily lysophospholipase